ncbi:MAG: WbqC family protein [Rhizobiales bacterium]|nr:WbqC family protein [Hyphomicrobiales bacterium]
MTVVAIHQPNFLPWLGFFDKLARADKFVILDSVPLQLTGGNYTNRVRMIVNGVPAWITMPLRRGHDARNRIDQAEVVDEPKWRRKIRSTIAQSYAKAKFFDLAMGIVDRMLDLRTASLADINMTGIVAVAEVLGLSPAKIVRSSALSAGGHSNELLANLVTAVGGDTYLAGHGAGGYQDDDVFASRGIAVKYQDYAPPTYPQIGNGEFIPGMSAIDALMNCGQGAAKLIGSQAG